MLVRGRPPARLLFIVEHIADLALTESFAALSRECYLDILRFATQKGLCFEKRIPMPRRGLAQASPAPFLSNQWPGQCSTANGLKPGIVGHTDPLFSFAGFAFRGVQLSTFDCTINDPPQKVTS